MDEQRIIEELSRFVDQTKLRGETALARSAEEVYEAIRPYLGLPDNLSEVRQVNFPSEAISVLVELSKASLGHIVKGKWLQDWMDRFRVACRGITALDDLSEIKSALGLPDDTPEPLVGVIWRLEQRIEDLGKEIKQPIIEGLGNPSLWRGRSTFQFCKEHFGGVSCDRVKGHIGHHWGLWRTNPDRRVEWRYEDDGTT